MPFAACIFRLRTDQQRKDTKAQTDKVYDKARRGTPQRVFHSSTEWQNIRWAKLVSQPRCEPCMAKHPPRLTIATEVDHIVPISQGGSMREWANLQSICRTCHARKTAKERGMPYAARVHSVASTTKVTLVGGPPAGGKSTYVKKHAKCGDLIVDFDMLYAALSGQGLKNKPLVLLPFVCEASDAVLARLNRDSDVRRAWVITCTHDRAEFVRLKQRLNAKSVMLIPDAKECKRRARNDDARDTRQTDWDGLIDRWHANCGGDPSDW